MLDELLKICNKIKLLYKFHLKNILVSVTIILTPNDVFNVKFWHKKTKDIKNKKIFKNGTLVRNKFIFIIIYKVLYN